MLPGRTYGLEEILRIIWSRKLLIAVSAVFGAALSTAVLRLLPREYRSEALIMVVPQRIPESYVKATVTEKVEDRLATLSDRTLSRSRLQQAIFDFGLYQDRLRSESIDDVVTRMRGDVKITVSRNETIALSYRSSDPAKAQQVTQRLASLFIAENSQDRESQAENTNQFLESQLEDAKLRLMDSEKKLEEYRRRYSGQLPEQATSNVQVLQGAEAQRLGVADAINRARERRTLVERQLLDLQSADPIVRQSTPAPVVTTSAAAEVTLEQRLVAARKALADLRLVKTPLHPDLRAAERRVAELEEQTQRQRPSGDVATVHTAVDVDPAEAARLRRIRDLTVQLADIEREIQEKADADTRLRAVIADHQTRLDAMPTRQSELIELTRDYETLQTMYQSLLTKREESKISADLERQSAGEQFRVIEPPTVPQRPSWPNARMIRLGGIAGGLVLALGLIGLMEYLDSTIRSEEEIARVLKVPVLASIPVIPVTSHTERGSGLAALVGGWRARRALR